MKPKVVAFSSFDEIKYLIFKKTDDFHAFLCGLLADLNFDMDEILKADQPFVGLSEDYLLLRNKDVKFHLFVTETQVHFVIDAPNPESIINKIKDISTFL